MHTRTSKLSGAWRLVFLLAIVALAAVPAAHAGPQGQLCSSDPGSGHGQGDGDLCAFGPAGCVAVGLRIDVAPNAALPGGAVTEFSRSAANAFTSGPASAYGHGDAHQVNATVPPTLGNGEIGSRCDVYSGEGFNWAGGDADVSHFYLSLYGYGVPVVLWGDVLHETGSSMNGAGSNTANIASLGGVVFGTPLPAISLAAAPNTTIPLGPLGTLYLNEQMVGFTMCPVFSGDALRLVVNDPTTGAQVAQILVSWVSTSTCP